jgi:hypothetical protein
MSHDPILKPLALDWEEHRLLMIFQESLHFCGCTGKFEKIGI